MYFELMTPALGMTETLRAFLAGQDDREKAADWMTECLFRHVCGDWGDVDEHDKAVNDEAIRNGSRIISSFNLPDWMGDHPAASAVWVITEADRSSTLALFPSDY